VAPLPIGACDRRSAGHRLGQIETLVLSPGVPLTHPKPHWSGDLARAAGVEIIGDIETLLP
jgi:UDP-N-acetylmuramoylalanine-D-glutamate ligase